MKLLLRRTLQQQQNLLSLSEIADKVRYMSIITIRLMLNQLNKDEKQRRHRF
jgi:hypothetical protein